MVGLDDCGVTTPSVYVFLSYFPIAVIVCIVDQAHENNSWSIER